VEVEPIRRLLLILPVLLVVLLSGCQNAFGYINARWISEIDLTYDSGEAETAPFESMIFKDGEFIKTMASAMNTSTRIAGELDYDADFRMKLVYGDGNPDFTVGQYGSGNGSLFKLFTLRPDHTIRELQIKGAASGLFISSPDRYSVKLDAAEGGFLAGHYDNALGQQIETAYRWDGAAFQEVSP
jgi:hypothetical protein